MKRTIIAAIMVCFAGSSAAARDFTLDDALALKYLSDARISPDGAWIAYVETRNDLDADEERTSIFIVSKDGAETIRMTGETYSAFAPRWRPDGKYLSFIATRDDLDENAVAQVYTLNLKGGEAQAFTAVAQGVEAHEWSPDGAHLLLTIRDESDAAKAARITREKGEAEKPRPHVIDRRQFKEDGAGYLDRSRAHLYILDERDGAPRQITFGDFEDSGAVWRPDGAAIAFVSNRTDEPDSNLNDDIFVVETGATAKAPALRRITDNPGADTAPAWSPDGARLAYIAQTEPALLWYATGHLAVIEADRERDGGARIVTAALDRNISAPAFSADGRSVIASVEDDGRQYLAEIDLETGAARPIIADDMTVFEFDLHPSGAIAAPASSPTAPIELYLHVDGTLARISDVNASRMKDVRFVAPQETAFKSDDGATIKGFIFPSANGRKKAPGYLLIHGGPTGQYDRSFNDSAQLFAANGYAVIMPNPRGSTGFGQDFASALFADWGGVDFGDVMAAVDVAIARGLVDPLRLGVGGWSYGGILTNHVITKTDRFDAAWSGASEVIYIGNYGHDIYQREWEMELGLPWEKREAWEKITPFYDIAKVKTPTLVMGGAEDWNVPVVNSEQLYQALKRLDVPTELIVYPGEDHSIDRPSFVRDRYQRQLDWFRRFIK